MFILRVISRIIRAQPIDNRKILMYVISVLFEKNLRNNKIKNVKIKKNK
tara:strand:+ start:597 stop:743 length:147 start_codon:yes stop_codon:yes gene_type:complete